MSEDLKNNIPRQSLLTRLKNVKETAPKIKKIALSNP